MSISTTSANDPSATPSATDAPTLPAPTTVTWGRAMGGCSPRVAFHSGRRWDYARLYRRARPVPTGGHPCKDCHVTAVIQTEKLTKFYGEHRGIIEVDLEVIEGESFGFLG